MIPGDQPPSSFRDTLGDRLIGLAMIVGGLLGFGLVYLLWLYAPAQMPVPPGLPRNLLPIVSPLNCVLPATGVGSALLVLMGLKRMILPE